MVVADGAYKHGGVLRQPAHRVALWRAQYDSDKILPDLNVMTILDGPLLARSGRSPPTTRSESANRVVLIARRSLPIYPDERTSKDRAGMSQKCHELKGSSGANLVRFAFDNGHQSIAQ